MTRAIKTRRKLAGICTLSMRVLLSMFFASLIIAGPPCLVVCFDARAAEKVRNLECQFVTEDNCPIQVVNLSGQLELDPFDAPESVKIYIDYKNPGDKAIAAAKFRMRLTDAQAADKGTFQAIDQTYVAGQGQRSQKWKRDFVINPAVCGLKCRVLQVKFEDGSIWNSVKNQEADKQ